MTDESPARRAGDPATGGGTEFGQYRLLDLLGRGGMGEVWRAYHAVIDRIVALKVLPEHFAQDEQFQQRFRREAHLAAQLNNAHVIPIHTYGEINGRLFVDMRLIDGRDLKTVLADGPLELARAVRIVEQVAKALLAAHKIGLVHRDVKPSNILLDGDDHAYLIDFGIARAAGDTTLTGTGTFIGSWQYMAPERFGAGPTDARADVYALACVLFECLTGQTPYPGDSLEQQYAGHTRTPPPRPTSLSPDLPGGFDTVIDKGMAKNPDDRFATTADLARAAREASTEPIPQVVPPTVPSDLEPPQPPTQAATLAADQPASRRSPWRRRTAIVARILPVVILVGIGEPLALQNARPRHPIPYAIGVIMVYIAIIYVAVSIVLLTVKGVRYIRRNRLRR
jgi:serine/threonine-protein kinase